MPVRLAPGIPLTGAIKPMSHTIAFALLLAVLIVAAVTDLRTGRVYNWLTYTAMIGGLTYWTVLGMIGPPSGAGLTQSAIALAAGLVPMIFVVRLGGLGGGDAKLMGAVGALSASAACVLSTLVYALLVGVLMALAVMLRHGLVKQTLRRLFGAALLVGARIKPTVDEQSPRIAFGMAIAVGGTLAGVQHLLGVRLPWSWIGT